MRATVSGVMRIGVSVMVLALLVSVPVRADQQEAKVGAQVYKWLKNNGKIVEQSPLYDILNPIADPIKAVADPLYDAPFVFTLGRDPYPNVASVPGGRVYLSEKTFDFLKYREELGGALCHAVAHTVNHDYVRLVRKNANAQLGSLALWFLIMAGGMTSAFSNPVGLTKAVAAGTLKAAGGNPSGATDVVNAMMPGMPGANAAAGALTTVSAISAAEQAERDADVTGADLCAKAGINPWGIVWLLENYRRSPLAGRMEMLTDNPGERVRNLVAHFASNSDLFGKFDSDRAHATPLRGLSAR